MLFNSFDFLVLVLVTLLLYYLPLFRHGQVSILIISSMVFYAWFQPWLLLLLLFSALINSAMSYAVEFCGDYGEKKRWVIAGVALNIGVLAIFKYGPLGIETAGRNLPDPILEWFLSIPLPLGISFYTFQGISLLIDVFRGEKQGAPLQKLPIQTPIRYLRNGIFYIIFVLPIFL